MVDRYPLIFESTPGRTTHPFSGPAPWPWPWAISADGSPIGSGSGAKFTVDVEAQAGQECHEFVLAQIKGWPETKTEFDLRCVTVLGHKVCTKVPVIYHRSCTLDVVVDVCYPTGALNDVAACVTGAGMAAAVAAVISGGSAAAATFKAALETCLLAKGAKWASEVTVSVPAPKTDCGPWHPV